MSVFDVDDNVFFPVFQIRQILLLWGEVRKRCSFYGYMEQAFAEKLRKYPPLAALLDSLGWRYKKAVLIFGSLGHVHRPAVRGLQGVGLTKTRAKQLAMYYSVSVVVGSLAVWRRRCFQPSGLEKEVLSVHRDLLKCLNPF